MKNLFPVQKKKSLDQLFGILIAIGFFIFVFTIMMFALNLTQIDPDCLIYHCVKIK